MTRSVEQAFAESELPMPETPARWRPLLREREEWLFCTGRPPAHSLYDFNEFANAALSGLIENGLVIGRQGYGVNNWALHYYLIEEDLLLLLQRRWGNVYDDPRKSRGELDAAFVELSQLPADLRRMKESGRKLPDKLTILDRARAEPNWMFESFFDAANPPSVFPDIRTAHDALLSEVEPVEGL